MSDVPITDEIGLRTEFEYEVGFIPSRSDMLTRLNELGREGWQLIETEQVTTGIVLVMIRQR